MKTIIANLLYFSLETNKTPIWTGHKLNLKVHRFMWKKITSICVVRRLTFKIILSLDVKYICLLQYTTGKDGSTVGVTVTRNGALSHCKTLTVACNYTEGKTYLYTVNDRICNYNVCVSYSCKDKFVCDKTLIQCADMFAYSNS